MAETLFIRDGTTRIIFNVKDRRQVLVDVIREKLGNDCEDLFYDIIKDVEERQASGGDYEKIADGYHAMLLDTMEELEALLLLFKAPR